MSMMPMILAATTVTMFSLSLSLAQRIMDDEAELRESLQENGLTPEEIKTSLNTTRLVRAGVGLVLTGSGPVYKIPAHFCGRFTVTDDRIVFTHDATNKCTLADLRALLDRVPENFNERRIEQIALNLVAGESFALVKKEV